MYTHDEIVEAMTIQQAAIPQMEDLGIPITPHNYAVWFRYIAGEESELNSVIEVMLRRGDSFSEETMGTLYEQFCTDINEAELQALREELQTLVNKMHLTIAEVAGKSDSFSSSLVGSSQEMANADSVQEIRSIISRVVSETEDFAKVNADLSKKFTNAQKEMDQLRSTLSSLQEEVRRDELTGIPNRKAFDEFLYRQVSLSKRQQRPFSLLMIDIDHFKQFNDTFGHLVGDDVLKFVAKKIEQRVRAEDIAARFGGEEFAIVLPETTIEDAYILAESLRSFFDTTPLRRDKEDISLGRVTVSIGIAEFAEQESSKELIHRADNALYAAKQGGRNRVVVSED